MSMLMSSISRLSESEIAVAGEEPDAKLAAASALAPSDVQ